MSSPSTELAEVIATLLNKSSLLLPEDVEKYKYKIAVGSMNAEDWLLATEKALIKASNQ